MSSFEQKNFEYKQPDEIIIEDSASVNVHSQEDSRKQESLQSDQFKQQKTPISLRFICFLGLVFCMIFGLGMLFFSLISSLFVLITAFQSKKINSACYHFWKLYVNAVVAGVGFILGLIVPPIGLGFLLLYFSMIGETLDSNILTKILRKSFKFQAFSMNGLANLISYIPFPPTPIINAKALTEREVQPLNLGLHARIFSIVIFISCFLGSLGYILIQYKWIVLNEAFGLFQVSNSLSLKVVIIQGLGPADLKIPLIYLLNRLQPSMKSLLQEVEYRKAARNLIAQALRDYLNLPCPRVAASFWLIQDLDALKKFFTMGQNQSKCNASQQTLVIHAFCQSKLGILHAMKNIKNFY